MTDNRSTLMKEVQMARFSLVETNLYLDTHPYDCEAMMALEYYGEKLSAAIEKYEEECGALFADSVTSIPFDWVKNPFPWEVEC